MILILLKLSDLEYSRVPSQQSREYLQKLKHLT